ncbi:hypothetical protein Vafri_11025 [Volvox africanus]|nr:hypothetical protein Vafri_11025 [Volvox africanus]
MYSMVREMGGYAAVAAMSGGWEKVAERLGLDKAVVNTPHACRSVYEHYLLRAERLEKAREAAGIPLQPPAPRGAPPGSPTASGPSMETAGGDGAAAAVAAIGPVAPAPLKLEPNSVDCQTAATAAVAAERSERAFATATAGAAVQRAPPPPQQQQVDRQPPPAARRAAAAAPPAGPQWTGAASGSRAGGAQLSGQYERRGVHIEEGGRSVRDGPGGRGPYGSGSGRNAGGPGYDSGLSEGRGGYDNLEREEYEGPGDNEYDEPSRAGYDALLARSGYGGLPRSSGYESGSGALHILQGGSYEGGGGGGRGGYDSSGRRSFDIGGRGGYEQGFRAGYSSTGGRGGYDGGGRGYSLPNRFYDGPAGSGGSGGSGSRYRNEAPSLERRLALEALLQSTHGVQPQLRLYDNQYEQRSSLLPHHINDDQLLLAAGLGLQSAVGRDGGGGPGGSGGGAVVNPLHLDSAPVGRQQPGGLHFGRDGGGGGGGRLQLQLGGGGGRQQQQQEAREAMLVTLAGGPGGSSALSTRGGLMQAFEQAGLVSVAGGPVSNASRLLPGTRGGGGDGGGGADALHPGWLSRGGGRGSGTSGALQLQGGRAAALLGFQRDLADGVDDHSTINSLLSGYFGGGGGLPVGLVRTGSGSIGISGLGLAGGGGSGLGGGGSGGGGGVYKRGQPDNGGPGGSDHGGGGGGGGGGPHKRQAL